MYIEHAGYELEYIRVSRLVTPSVVLTLGTSGLNALSYSRSSYPILSVLIRSLQQIRYRTRVRPDTYVYRENCVAKDMYIQKI